MFWFPGSRWPDARAFTDRAFAEERRREEGVVSITQTRPGRVLYPDKKCFLVLFWQRKPSGTAEPRCARAGHV